MRRYETIFIIDPDISSEDHAPIFERLKDLFPQHDGMLITTEEWGNKKLAYEIKKKARGYYIRIDYCGTGKLVDEIERFFRIDDRVLKYMTVLLEKDVDIETIKEEMAMIEAKKRASEQADLSSGDSSDESDNEPVFLDESEPDTSEDETTVSINNTEELKNG